MKRIMVLVTGLVLSAQMAQAQESAIYSIFGEPGKQGVLKQLTAILKAAELDKKSLNRSETAAACPEAIKLGPMAKPTSEINSTDLRCQFAYDLHRFVASKNRDYDSLLNPRPSFAISSRKAKPSYLPYREQEDYSNGWWLKKSKSYKESSDAEKKLFLHQAIVDATSLYGLYGRRVYGTSAYVAWEEASLQAVLKKQ